MMHGSLRVGRLVAVPLRIGMLTACSSILPKRGPAPDLYQLSPVSLDREPKPVSGQITVDVPLAARGLDTDRIIVRNNPYEVKYLEGMRWTDRVPRLVQSAIIQALESAGAFTAVGRPEDGIRSAYVLLSDLRAFDVLDMGHTKVQVILSVKLVRPGGDVMASRLMTKEVDAKSGSDRDLVAAFDEAVRQIAAETMHWAVGSVGPSAKPSPSASADMPSTAPATP